MGHALVCGHRSGPTALGPRRVHADSFLATALVWGPAIPGGPDAYVREWAKAGELVGVVDPPRSVAELREQLRGFAPTLRGDEATAKTVAFIRNAPLPLPARPAYAGLFAGAVSTLPRLSGTAGPAVRATDGHPAPGRGHARQPGPRPWTRLALDAGRTSADRCPLGGRRAHGARGLTCKAPGG
jgi:hypothetical protein